MITVILVIILLWATGFGFGIGGSLIHALLLIALIIFILQIVGNRPTL